MNGEIDDWETDYMLGRWVAWQYLHDEHLAEGRRHHQVPFEEGALYQGHRDLLIEVSQR